MLVAPTSKRWGTNRDQPATPVSPKRASRPSLRLAWSWNVRQAAHRLALTGVLAEGFSASLPAVCRTPIRRAALLAYVFHVQPELARYGRCSLRTVKANRARASSWSRQLDKTLMWAGPQSPWRHRRSDVMQPSPEGSALADGVNYPYPDGRVVSVQLRAHVPRYRRPFEDARVGEATVAGGIGHL